MRNNEVHSHCCGHAPSASLSAILLSCRPSTHQSCTVSIKSLFISAARHPHRAVFEIILCSDGTVHLGANSNKQYMLCTWEPALVRDT